MTARNLLITRRAQAINTATMELSALGQGLELELPPLPIGRFPNVEHQQLAQLEFMAAVLRAVREKVLPDVVPQLPTAPLYRAARPIKYPPGMRRPIANTPRVDPVPQEPIAEIPVVADRVATVGEVTRAQRAAEPTLVDDPSIAALREQSQPEVEPPSEAETLESGEELFAGKPLSHYAEILEREKPASDKAARRRLIEEPGVTMPIAQRILLSLESSEL